MEREEKAKEVDEIADVLSKSRIAILVDFRGVSTSGVTQLRRQLREAGAEYRVVKNTLTVLAAKKTGKEGLNPMLAGPTAMALGYADDVAPARVLADFIKASGAGMRIKGGILGSRIIDARQVSLLPSIPPKPLLVADLLGKMKSPITMMVLTLAAPLRGLACVLQARARQLEQQAVSS